MSGPPLEETPRKPKPITQCFFDAREAFNGKYGAFNPSDAEYHISAEMYLRLLGSLGSNDLGVGNPPTILDTARELTIYGIKIVVHPRDAKAGNRWFGSFAQHNKCVLVHNYNMYHFEIPEPQKVKPPPRPDPCITPVYRCDFGAFDFVWDIVLRLIDWLNDKTGAEKSKRKNDDSTGQMTELAELFDGYDERPQASKTPHIR